MSPLRQLKENIKGCEMHINANSFWMRYLFLREGHWDEVYLCLDSALAIAKFFHKHNLIDYYKTYGERVVMYKGYENRMDGTSLIPCVIELEEIELTLDHIKHFAAVSELTIITRLYGMISTVGSWFQQLETKRTFCFSL